jgi:hypothetical protein
MILIPNLSTHTGVELPEEEGLITPLPEGEGVLVKSE